MENPRRFMCVALWLALAAGSRAAEPAGGVVVIRVRSGAAPITHAEVTAGGRAVETDVNGEARLDLPAGQHEIAVLHPGFAPASVVLTVRAGEEAVATVQLRELRFEDRVVVVSATRSGKVIEDQPLRVEAVPEEEIEENATIAPGSLATLLNELAGVRVQATAPALGGAQLRLRGLSGRYTQILSDELPLYGQELDAFSLLQVPPLDLARVEVLKGAATALYGGSALGGVINLVSRRPGGEPEAMVTQTSRGGTDAVGFGSGTLAGKWGFTLLGSAHRQRETDLDDDGWADVAGYRRAVVRPRVFWDDQAGRSFFATVGAMAEEREGGTVEGATTPAGEPYHDVLRTQRFDGGVVARFLLGNARLLSVHASFAGTARARRLGGTSEHEERESGLGEVSLTGSARGHTWVVGGALAHDGFRARERSDLDHSYTVPAVFAQDDWALSGKVSLAASGRLDLHNEYGAFLSPMAAVLVRPATGLSLRLSAGGGFAAPVPFNERTDAAGFSRLLPLRGLQPERAWSASLDIGWSAGAFELNGSMFASRVRDALVIREPPSTPGRFELANASEPTRTVGTELLVRYSQGPLHVIGTHTFVHATESGPTGGGRREVPLTPRHAGELAVIVEDESRGRIGAELSYTGAQRLEDNPYRSVGASYLELNVLGELRLGEIHVFANAVNLTDVRQTHFDPLLLPARAPDGRWTTEAWAPLLGRVLSVGVRVEF